MLLNLNELYATFKFESPAVEVGFSKFCQLRPKWCVLAGSASTHAVCVCSIHQNVELLLQAANIEEKSSDLVDFLVCSKSDRNCMLRHCDRCPSNERLKQFIIGKFEDGSLRMKSLTYIGNQQTGLNKFSGL